MTTIIDVKDVRPFDLVRPLAEPSRVTFDSDGRAHMTGRVERVELLHRPTPKPKPYAGLLTGAEVKATPWKRGTKLMLVRDGVLKSFSLLRGVTFTLEPEGWWLGEGKTKPPPIDFDGIFDADLFALIWRPAEAADEVADGE